MSAADREITAAAVAIHDIDCPDRTCSGSALGHCYKLARAALEAAAEVRACSLLPSPPDGLITQRTFELPRTRRKRHAAWEAWKRKNWGMS